MSRVLEVRVPDLGDFDQVDVVEVLVKTGDSVIVEQGLITLESDKASMEVPAPQSGIVRTVEVKAGDKIGPEGLIATLELADAAQEAEVEVAAKPPTPSAGPPTPAPATGASVTASDHDLTTEVLVLGSGPGGYTAAFRAADLGKKVTLVERYPILGGVCLNVGCIPSKALLHMAEIIEAAAAFESHGVAFGAPKFDLDQLRAWKDGIVNKLTGGLATMAKQRKVEIVQGHGTFASPHELEIETAEGPRRLRFEHAIIAAGSQPTRLPGLPYDDPRLIDSTGALELASVPRRMLILGGGIIGLEMATVYHALGAKITVVELLDGLIPGADRDIVRPFQRFVDKRYENIFLSTKVTRIESEKKGLRVFFEGGKAPESDVFDRVLVAVGRRPNGPRISAEKAGVTVDQAGFIAVDKELRTNVPHIFAIGDIVGQPMLAHKATHEGKVAAEVIAGLKSSFDARVIPSVAYTDPEIAWVGVTEQEAKEKGLAIGVGTFPWSASGRSLGLGRGEGKTKLIFDETTERVIGAGIVGPHAGDLIAEVTLAIEMGCEARDIGLTIHPHPTLSETIALSAEAFEGTLTDLYLPKRKRK